MMTEIKLLSIKRNEEASYFYENANTTTLDSVKRNEMSYIEENHKDSKTSKKARREAKSAKKEQKKLKKQEKGKKHSKNSGKDNPGNITVSASNQANGDITSSDFSNLGFHGDSNANVVEARKTRENGGLKEERNASKRDVLEEENVSDHEPSIINQGNKITGKQQTTLEIPAQATNVEIEEMTELEDPIKAEGVTLTEEAPAENSQQPKVDVDLPEPAEGQLVEIEISEITDVQTESSGAGGETDLGQNYQISLAQNNAVSGEEEILVATVHEVESQVDFDHFFTEQYGEVSQKGERRKSVRFQESVEEIEQVHNEQKEDEERASGSDDATKTIDEKITDKCQPSEPLEPTIEIINKDKKCQPDSGELDLEEIFGSPELEIKHNGIAHNEEIADSVVSKKVNSFASNTINSEARADRDSDDLHIENIQSGGVKKKKEHQRSAWMRCCFP